MERLEAKLARQLAEGQTYEASELAATLYKRKRGHDPTGARDSLVAVCGHLVARDDPACAASM